jgi:transglutaminase-like putative cysteine protease
MRRFTICCTLAVLSYHLPPALAQFKEGDPGGPKQGVAQSHRYKAGVVVRAVGGPCRAIKGYVPIPMEWPEQTVKVVEQEVSPSVKVSYQTLGETAKLMVVRMDWIPANETAKAVFTFEINRSMQLLPDDKSAFVLPVAKDLSPSLRRYLTMSPKIEVQNPAIRKAAKEIGANAPKAWDRVEALYDWMRTKVSYKTGGAVKGAAAALKDGSGNHDDMTSLFVALCRAAEIPARTVWVPEFCYAEFYLLDKKGEGHWLPCSPAGTKAFGEMPETKPVLAKGDNFVAPSGSREHQRYIREYLTGEKTPGGGDPSHQFIREMSN